MTVRQGVPIRAGRLISRTIEARRMIDFSLGIGESPVWDHQAGVLWFVDIEAPAIFRWESSGRRIERFSMPTTIGSLGLATEGRLVVALRNGIHLFDPATRGLEFLAHPEPDRPANRLNDGRVGPDGAFWIGSMCEAHPYRPTAALYRVTADGAARRVFDGLHVSNGLAWSPNGRTLYHADTLVPEICAYDLDPQTGAVGSLRRRMALDPADGRPDGAAVDSEGCYWSAVVSSGRLNRISPDGELIETLSLPVARPTMPCFGGQNLRTLFITSLCVDQNGAAEPGTLIGLDVGVAGLPAYRFGSPH